MYKYAHIQSSNIHPKLVDNLVTPGALILGRCRCFTCGQILMRVVSKNTNGTERSTPNGVHEIAEIAETNRRRAGSARGERRTDPWYRAPSR